MTTRAVEKRLPAQGAEAMVVSPHRLASRAGLAILEQGGGAVEAAVAVAAALTVVYPHMNALGGDNFWLIYNAKSGELKALNASGRSGEAASIGFYTRLGYDQIPARGYLAANTVPGAVSGWESAYDYARTAMGARLPWAHLLEAAIGYARAGFPLSASQEQWTRVNINPADDTFRHLQRFAGFRKTFLRTDGQPYKAGELFRQGELADTLSILAREGPRSFYTGVIAQAIVTELQANGGMLTASDFAQHTADWVTPLTVGYRDLQACNFPPNTQGVASLAILNILNNFDLTAVGEGTADHCHLIVEATKQAFADRDRWVTDPEFADIPLEYLLSVEHGKAQAARIAMSQAALKVDRLDPKGDTVWLGVVDKAGNAVSLIQSIYHDFGSGIVVGDTGVILQNRGSFFSLEPGNINCLAPRKRTFHTLNPAMLFKQGKPYLVYGTMGGEGQPQTQAAIVTRIIDFGLNVQEAIDAPRWLYGRTWGACANDLKIEGRLGPTALEELSRRGHQVNVMDDYTDVMGHAGAILIDPATGVRYGAADPRSDGTAEGY
jgi:oxamate amidohydrolase